MPPQVGREQAPEQVRIGPCAGQRLRVLQRGRHDTAEKFCYPTSQLNVRKLHAPVPADVLRGDHGRRPVLQEDCRTEFPAEYAVEDSSQANTVPGAVETAKVQVRLAKNAVLCEVLPKNRLLNPVRPAGDHQLDVGPRTKLRANRARVR